MIYVRQRLTCLVALLLGSLSARWLLICLALAAPVSACSSTPADATSELEPPALPVCENLYSDLQDGDVEAVGNVEVTHRFRLASDICWHYVEAGHGPTLAFVHGFPESWWSWHRQIEALASDFHVIAIDMKAYGQTSKPQSDYRAVQVAEETFSLLGSLSGGKIHVVSHDWGSIISERLACAHADRIGRFVRMQAPLMIVDLANAPQLELFKDQAFARSLMSDPETLMQLAYGRLTLEPLPADVLARIADEFRYPGIADAVPQYFRDLELNPTQEQVDERRQCFASMTFPVLLLQADTDRNQPATYFDGATDLFPDAELRWVTASGHFSELEQPEQVSQAIGEFVSR